MDETWTISELVDEVERRIAALPAPKNGQVRAVPDERTIRYYATIGLLDRPAAMRGRTALYGRKHVAQIVAIKRLQTMGRTLAEIQALWPTLDDATLSRMAGVELPAVAAAKQRTRAEFWKREPAATRDVPREVDATPPVEHPPLRSELHVELAPNVSLAIAISDELAISPADVAAIRAAAAPLIAELARRRLAVHAEGDDV